MAVKTSFKKKSSSKPDHPRGTRPSLHNAQLQVSTGVPSLDSLLGMHCRNLNQPFQIIPELLNNI